MARFRIVFPDFPWPSTAPEHDAFPGHDLIFHDGKNGPPPEGFFKGADAIIAYHMMRHGEASANAASEARVLVRAGTGLDNVDVDAFACRGIGVFNLPAYAAEEIGDHVFALLLTVTRGLDRFRSVPMSEAIPMNDANAAPLPPLVGRLAGRRMLIVGMGATGRAVLQRATGFGLDCSWTGPRDKTDVNAPYIESLPNAVADADIISLHCPYVPNSAPIISSELLDGVKQDAILINTARGQLIDEAAVAKAIQSGKLGAYAADVVWPEPISDTSPLASLPSDRCVLTPHIAWAGPQAFASLRLDPIHIALKKLQTT